MTADKEKVISELSECLELLDCAGTREDCKKIVRATKEFVEQSEKIVRCKNCWKRPYDNCPFNEFVWYEPEDDFFCGEGERDKEVQ